ncbi:hypothetical protein ml_128 [Mollivirus sibericum]|uniref:hypothetical protein n=1 Tax=Mollivirus sibericum TaxID=1678078 RepID=UPI0006B2EBF9|nr:hypothetical protein ml_128 [Mollivirus sibericum]ALD61930.1 hypothetical protein ml_128 [Mollivirus sibericum]
MRIMQSATTDVTVNSLVASIPSQDTITCGLIKNLLCDVDLSRPSPAQAFADAIGSTASAYAEFVETYGWAIFWLTQATELKCTVEQLHLKTMRKAPNDPWVSNKTIALFGSAIKREKGAELLDWHRTIVALNGILATPDPGWGCRGGHPLWGSSYNVAALVNAVLRGSTCCAYTGACFERAADPTWIAFVRWCLLEGGSNWKEQLYILSSICGALAGLSHLDHHLEPYGPVLVEWMVHIYELAEADGPLPPQAPEIWHYAHAHIYKLCNASRYDTTTVDRRPAPNLERIGAQLSVYVCFSVGFKKGDNLADNLWESVLRSPDAWESAPINKNVKKTSMLDQLGPMLYCNDEAKGTLTDYACKLAKDDAASPAKARFFGMAFKLLAESQ